MSKKASTQRKLKIKKRYIFLALLIIFIIASISYIENPTMMGQKRGDVMLGIYEEEGTGISVGRVAVNFFLETPEKEIIELKQFKNNKAIILNFWATWCKPCEEEMKLFQKLKDSYDDIEVVAVNLQENPNVVRQWIDERGFDFIILMDPLGELKTRYNIFTQPVTYFIDKQGIIQDRKFGPLIEDELYNKFEKIK